MIRVYQDPDTKMVVIEAPYRESSTKPANIFTAEAVAGQSDRIDILDASGKKKIYSAPYTTFLKQDDSAAGETRDEVIAYLTTEFEAKALVVGKTYALAVHGHSDEFVSQSDYDTAIALVPKILTGKDADPTSKVTPEKVGDLYLDGKGSVYINTDGTKTGWQKL